MAFLDIRVTVKGDKVLVEKLGAYSRAITAEALPRALRKIAAGTAREAMKNLQGPARGVHSKRARRSGRQRAVAGSPGLAGGYPVPRVTGNLLRLLRWLGPGRSVSTSGVKSVSKTFATGPLEAVVFDSALYAGAIHGGFGSSAKYGARPYLDDAFRSFNAGSASAQAVDFELGKTKRSHGLE